RAQRRGSAPFLFVSMELSHLLCCRWLEVNLDAAREREKRAAFAIRADAGAHALLVLGLARQRYALERVGLRPPREVLGEPAVPLLPFTAQRGPQKCAYAHALLLGFGGRLAGGMQNRSGGPLNNKLDHAAL